jgi:hypothetical protein
MGKDNFVARNMAMAGVLMVAIPILAPFVIAVAGLFRDRRSQFDYLMPAELFPVILIGGILLVAAAAMTRLHVRLAGWSLGLAAGLLIGSQALAVVTGLASGETKPAGWLWALVIAALAGYWLAIIALGVSGLLVLRDLFRESRSG